MDRMDQMDQMDRWKPETEQLAAQQGKKTELIPNSPGFSGLEFSNHRLAVEQMRKPAPPANGSVSPTLQIENLIHDARNMVSAIDLYCDLLAEPEVLSTPFRHYAGDLRLIGDACRRLLEKIALGASTTEPAKDQPQRTIHTSNLPSGPAANPTSRPGSAPALPSTPEIPTRREQRRAFLDGQPVENLADELLANQNLLSALAGPGITVSLAVDGGQQPVSMTRDDLTRIMVNLVRNAAEAITAPGRIQISLREESDHLSLTIEDSGRGIPEDSLEAIFSVGFSHHSADRSEIDSASSPQAGVWPVRHRGLGLSIVRAIVSAAGGSVRAINRISSHADANQPDASVPNSSILGAVIEIELPRLEPAISS